MIRGRRIGGRRAGDGGPREDRGVRALLTVLLLLGAALPAASEDEPAAARWEVASAGLVEHGVTSLRIHPRAADRWVASVAGIGVAVSTDGGAAWRALSAGIDEEHRPTARHPARIALDQRDPSTLWLASGGKVYTSNDAGETWLDRTSGVLTSWSWDRRDSRPRIAGLIVAEGESLHVLAGSPADETWRGGLYETSDGGKRWEQIAGPSDEFEGSGLEGGAWPLVLDPRTDKNVLAGSTEGFYLSDDRGRSFERREVGDQTVFPVAYVSELTNGGREVYLCDARGVWQSRDGGKRWGKKPVLEGDAVTVGDDPRSRKRLYALLRDRGLCVTEDSRRQKWEVLGHADLEATEILVHPTQDNVVFLASPVTGLHRSADGGATFASVTPEDAPLPDVVPAMAAAVLHPTDQDTALAATVAGVVYRSADRGVTWERVGRLGMEPTLLRADAASGTWWAAGRSLLRSADGGATWEEVWRPDDPFDHIVEMVTGADGHRWLLLDRSRSVAHSEDGGETWAVGSAVEKSTGVRAVALAVDPGNVEHLLVALRTGQHLWTRTDEEGGPYESWDGGASWHPLHEGLWSKQAATREWNRGRVVVVDPAAGVLVYAADGAGVFVRRLVAPGEKPRVRPTWVPIPSPVPTPRVASALFEPAGAEGTGGRLTLQLEGEDAAQALAVVEIAALRARLDAVEAGEEIDEAEVLWSSLPPPPEPVTGLAADPHVPGRLLAVSRGDVGGVHAYGVPGARPAPPPGGDEEGAVGPPSDAPPPRPDAGLLACTAGADGMARVWDLAAGEKKADLAGHEGPVTAVAVAPDGSWVATAGADRTIRRWNAADGAPLGVLGGGPGEAAVNALAVAPDGAVLYAGTESTWQVLAWDLAANTSRALEGHTDGVTCLAVSPDGTRLVSGSRDRSVRVWDPAAGTQLLRIDVAAEPLALAITPDGVHVLVGVRGATLRAYALADGTTAAQATLSTTFIAALSTDGQHVFAGGEGGVRVLDRAALTPVRTLTAGTAPVVSTALSRDGRFLVGGDLAGGVWLWATDREAPLWQLATGHAGAVLGVALAAPGTAAPGDGAAAGDGDAADGSGGGASGDAAPGDAAPGDAGTGDGAAGS